MSFCHEPRRFPVTRDNRIAALHAKGLGEQRDCIRLRAGAYSGRTSFAGLSRA